LFLDDGLVQERDKNTCVTISQKIKRDLGSAGFITNDEKSVWQPCQRIQWLGLIWDSQNGTLSISDTRVLSIEDSIRNIFSKKCIVSARELSSLVGKIISGGAVYGKVSRIMTRYCSITVAARQDWDTRFPLDEYCIKEIKFWEANARSMNTKSLFNGSVLKSHYIVYSDASQVGCGAHIEFNGEQVCHKLWQTNKCEKSSTWRELAAIEFALESFLPIIKGIHTLNGFQTVKRLVESSRLGV